MQENYENVREDTLVRTFGALVGRRMEGTHRGGAHDQPGCVLPRPVRRRRGQPAATRAHGRQAPAGLHRAQTRCTASASATPCGRVEQRERARDIWPSTGSSGRSGYRVRFRFRLCWHSLGRRGRGRGRSWGPEEPCERKETGEALGLLRRGRRHTRARLMLVVIVTVVVFVVDRGHVQELDGGGFVSPSLDGRTGGEDGFCWRGPCARRRYRRHGP